MVIWCWRQRCAQLGVRYLYKCGGKLVGERTRVPSTSWMTELSFANDAAVVASTREDLVKGTVELNSVVTACGLTISIPKTKFLVVGSYVMQSDLDPIVVGSDFITSVASFRYLGSLVESHGGVQLELNTRISRAASVFGALRRSVFSDHMLSTTTKCMVYQAVVLGVLLYAVETWPVKQREVHTLETSPSLFKGARQCFETVEEFYML